MATLSLFRAFGGIWHWMLVARSIMRMHQRLSQSNIVVKMLRPEQDGHYLAVVGKQHTVEAIRTAIESGTGKGVTAGVSLRAPISTEDQLVSITLQPA